MKRLFVFVICVLILTGCGSEYENLKDDWKNHLQIGSYKHVYQIPEEGAVFTKDTAMDRLEEMLELWNQGQQSESMGIMEEGMKINISLYIGEDSFTRDITLGTEEIYPGTDEMIIGKKTGYICKNMIIPPDWCVSNQSDDNDIVEATIITNYICEGMKYTQVCDSFIADMTDNEYGTVSEYIEYMTENLSDSIREFYGTQAFIAVMDGSKYKDIEPYIRKEQERLYNNYFSENELDSETYHGLEEEDLMEFLYTSAEYNVKKEIITYGLADELDITINEDEGIQHAYEEIIYKLYDMQQ